jgi:hypothetical protein
VTCDDGGFPARNAGVSLLAIEPSGNHGNEGLVLRQANTITDFDGHYIFRSVAPGQYYVLPRLNGYADDYELIQSSLSRFGPDRQKELLAALPQVTVRNGSVHKDVVIQRGGAITGRVLVDSGGPLVNQPVTATMVEGPVIRKLENGPAPQPLSMWRARGNTDDRGIYRLAGLPKGKYRIQVDARIGRDTGGGAITVFSPDSIKESGAKLVAVDNGDEISDMDITIPLASLHSIGGTVMRGGTLLAGASVTVSNKENGSSFELESKSDGTWRADLLAAGAYGIEVAYSSKNPDRGPQIKRKITITLSEVDILDADIELSGSSNGR